MRRGIVPTTAARSASTSSATAPAIRLADRLAAMFDIGAASLICGLTNVLTLASGCGDPYFSVRWTGLGIPLDKHSIGHGKGLDEKTAEQLESPRVNVKIAAIAKRITKGPSQERRPDPAIRAHEGGTGRRGGP